jgi:hypothetical protein
MKTLTNALGVYKGKIGNTPRKYRGTQSGKQQSRRTSKNWLY